MSLLGHRTLLGNWFYGNLLLKKIDSKKGQSKNQKIIVLTNSTVKLIMINQILLT